MINPSVTEFWKWFQDSEQTLAVLSPENACEEVKRRLSEVDSQIDVEIGYSPQGVRELVFTAHGDRTLFAIVRDVARGAPTGLAWEITSLKPPRGFDFEMVVGSLRLDPRRMVFEPLRAKGRTDLFGIRVFVPKDAEPTENWDHLARVIVETAIGEEMAGEIDMIDAGDEESQPADPLYLPELPRYLAWRRSRHKRA